MADKYTYWNYVIILFFSKWCESNWAVLKGEEKTKAFWLWYVIQLLKFLCFVPRKRSRILDPVGGLEELTSSWRPWGILGPGVLFLMSSLPPFILISNTAWCRSYVCVLAFRSLHSYASVYVWLIAVEGQIIFWRLREDNECCYTLQLYLNRNYLCGR